MVAGNSTPRMGKSGRGGKRGAKMSYGGAEDEELAELQKRFHALEEEARVTAERAQSLPGSTTATPRLHVRVARERSSVYRRRRVVRLVGRCRRRALRRRAGGGHH